MNGEVTIFDIIKVVLLWLSPLIFLESLLLLMLPVDKYTELEAILGKEIGGLKKRISKKLENNISDLHAFLLENKNVVGIICILCSMVFFFALRK